MTAKTLEDERRYLAELLEAIQRCVFFLDASHAKLTWPLLPEELARKRKDVALFESLAAINERFAKLQDTLGAAMRHAVLFSGESGETFLKILTFYGVCFHRRVISPPNSQIQPATSTEPNPNTRRSADTV